MNNETRAVSHLIRSRLSPAFSGLILAVLTLLLGFGLGIIFGLNEDSLKSRLKESATEVRDSVYHGDDSAIKSVLDKSWIYMQRAHLHAGSLGTTALALILLVSLLGASRSATCIISVALGAGGLGYSLFWLWAGFRAPALGSTGLAKESLRWLAIPSSGAIVFATFAIAVLLLLAMVRRPAPNTRHDSEA